MDDGRGHECSSADCGISNTVGMADPAYIDDEEEGGLMGGGSSEQSREVRSGLFKGTMGTGGSHAVVSE